MSAAALTGCGTAEKPAAGPTYNPNDYVLPSAAAPVRPTPAVTETVTTPPVEVLPSEDFTCRSGRLEQQEDGSYLVTIFSDGDPGSEHWAVVETLSDALPGPWMHAARGDQVVLPKAFVDRAAQGQFFGFSLATLAGGRPPEGATEPEGMLEPDIRGFVEYLPTVLPPSAVLLECADYDQFSRTWTATSV